MFRNRPRRLIRLLAACLALFITAALTGPPASASTLYHETYRPQFHFSPQQNWMNDPNGLIYYKGQYHLFFQYNPDGNTWGDMSWGHAVSTDLVHWKQLPLAIPQDANEMVFSGSVVFDRTDSSHLGTAANPPLVAIYTSAYKTGGKQAQSLAYSLDGGTTWTKYSGNPVLDLGSQNFRDPKVFWYQPTNSWLMTVALSDQHKVSFYSSTDLKSWTHLSDFGPAGAVGGAWECPDLFPLPVDGNAANTKWVLVVGTNPGAVAGGSGVQYFVGNFDGTAFTDDDPPYTPPTGDTLQDFDSATGYGSWTATGTAFGTAPATGTLPNQQQVTGFTPPGLANSFNGGDASTGELTSPAFTVTKPYLNFLIGGGDHPYVPGAGGGLPDQTSVNLVVDGTVVRSATGSDSENLDWTSWDLHDLVGQQAQIQLVDHDTSGWGHILADDFTAADTPALSAIQRAHWIDYGPDFYASSTFNDTPDGSRIMIGWMNNWQYGQNIPTSPWRSADSLPRKLSLTTVDGQIQLTQQPISLNTLRQSLYTAPTLTLDSATTPIPANAGPEFEAQVSLNPHGAQQVGMDVRTGPGGQHTRIGYDATTGHLFVDRTASGAVTFDPSFPSVESAPVTLDQGALTLHILVDAASVEVYTADGTRVLTTQIFPDPASTGLDVFADGGAATVSGLNVWKLASIWP